MDWLTIVMNEYPCAVVGLVVFAGVVLIGATAWQYKHTACGETVVVFGFQTITKPGCPVDPNGPNPPPPARDLVVERDVAALRTANGVSEVSGLEVGQNLPALPNGKYGFSPPWMIDTDATGVVGGTGFDRIRLGRYGGTAVMEVHKSSSGTVYVVGYLSDETLSRVRNQARGTARTSAILYFEPRQDRRAVAIPESMIVSSNNRSTEINEGDGIYINELQLR